jgi:hypothetical protein
VQVQVRAWDHIYKDPKGIDEGVAAIIAQRPDAKLDPELLNGQIVAYRAFLETAATKGKKTGWQADADWVSAIKSMEQAGAIKAGHKPSEYYTNEFVD